MPKNVMQDVIPKNKRSIRNIPIPGDGKKPRLRKFSDEKINTSYQGHGHIPPQIPSSRRKGKFILGIVSLCLLLIVGFMTMFSRATITIVAKTVQIAVSQTISSPTEESVRQTLVRMVELGDIITKDVPATQAIYVEEKAQGIITIYNDYDAKDQRLITNTRFQSDSGNIYRIRESVVVPGKKDGTPGSVDATVYADEAGDTYNVDDATFSIPGFKGDPRFEGFYAKTKTPLAGGFVGQRQQVAEGVMNDARRELDTTLRANLLGAVRSQLPEGFILPEDLIVITFEDVQQTEKGERIVTVGRKGTLKVPLLHNQTLSKLLIREQNISDETPYMITSLEGTSLSYTDETQRDDLVEFEINGALTLVADINHTDVRDALAGKPKKELSSILPQFPSIASAKASITPFWITTFPKKDDRIEILLQE